MVQNLYKGTGTVEQGPDLFRTKIFRVRNTVACCELFLQCVREPFFPGKYSKLLRVRVGRPFLCDSGPKPDFALHWRQPSLSTTVICIPVILLLLFAEYF
jgi:hypothetical protein